MKIFIGRTCLSLIVLSILIRPTKANQNETLVTGRQSRVSGRIVKLYSGPKPDPFLCTEEGFKPDPVHCSVFYRCIKSSSGKFTVFKFQCGPGTVYDPDIEVCNHPRNTKRSECGGLIVSAEQDVENDIELHELPSPISTILPIYASQATRVTTLDTHETPISDNVLTSPKEHGYEYFLSTSLAPIPPKPTTEKFVDLDYFNKTHENNSANTGSTTLNKSDPCTSDGFVGDSENCKKFYRCVRSSRGGFIRYEFSCSDPTVWDDNTQSCNHRWAVRNRRCGLNNKVTNFSDNNILPDHRENSYGTISVTTSKQHSQDTIKINDLPAYYEHKLQHVDALNTENTTKNYESHLYQFITTQENNNMETEPSLSSDKNKNESDKVTTSTSIYFSRKKLDNRDKNLNKVGTNFICTRSGFVGDGNNCNKFYRCVDNGKGSYTKYEFTCSHGTVWDKKLEACNYAWAVKECGGETASETSTPGILSTSESTIISNENINQGYFNQINAELTTTVTVTTPVLLISASEVSKISETQCTETSFIGDTNDCKKFYKCVDNGRGNFTKYEYTCGDGTVWDQKIEACNHAWAVKSCNSISPNTSSPIVDSNTSKISASPSLIEYTTLNGLQSTNVDYNTVYGFQQSGTTEKTETLVHIIGDEANCQRAGFVGDIIDCKKFYRCVINERGSYTRYEFSCGEGTVWDPEIESCNHAWAVKKCGGTIASEANALTTSTTSTTNIDVIELNNGYITPNYINTETTPSKNTQTTSPSNATIKIECELNGFIRDKTDCKKFYRCVDTGNGTYVKYNFSCSEGTAWDSEINACNHEWAVKECEHRSTELFYTPTSIPDNKEIVDSYFTSSIKNDNNYTENTTPYITTTTLLIDADNNIKCEFSGFMGDSSNCKKFYRCVENGNGGFIRYDFFCGEGAVWDSDINSCNHNKDVKKCRGTSPNELETTTQILDISSITHSYSSTMNSNNYNSSSTLAALLPLPDDSLCKIEGFFADPNDCKKFYRCVKNSKNQYTKYNFSCVNGTIWIQEMQTCDYDIDSTNCSSPLILTTTNSDYISITTQLSNTSNLSNSNNITQDSSEIVGIDECSSEGFYRNKNNCQHFYRCVNNNDGSYTKHQFSCAEGTAWDENIQSCNYINEVKNCLSSVHQVNSTEAKQEESDQTTEYYMTQSPSASTMNNPVLTPENNCKQEGYFGDTHNCQKFYRCVYDNDKGYTKYDYSCGEGTIWDSDVVACNHPYDVQKPSCKSEQETSSSIKTTPTLAPSSTTSVLITTDAPVSVSSVIPSGNNMTNLNCSNKSSDGNSASENFTCSKAGFYADPGNCKKFYRCVDWENDGKKFSIYHFECGEGTIWDPTIETCNHEGSVYPPRNCNGTQQGGNISEMYTTTIETITTTNAAETSTTSFETSNITQQTTVLTTTLSSSSNNTSPEALTTEMSTTQSTTTEVPTALLSTNKESTSQASTTTETLTTSKESITQLSTITETTVASSTAQELTTPSTTTVGDSTGSEQFPFQSTQVVTDHTTSPVDPELTTKLSTLQTTLEYSTTSESSASTIQITSSAVDGTTMGQVITEQSTNETPSQITNSQTTEAENLSSSTTEINTETSISTAQKCPDIDDDQSLYICPTSFKRHPRYCNMFYQCTEDIDSQEIKIATFYCPNNTIYDENKIQCVDEGKSNEKCKNKNTQKHRVKRLGAVYNDPIMISRESLACPHPGHFPFEKDFECSAVLLKCELTDSGKLRGYVYKCPEGFIYWNISRRCEAIENIRDCKRTFYPWKRRYDIPLERFNIAL